MKAVVLNIGNEVLSGKVINTNAAFLAQELAKIGVEVEKTIVVGDSEPNIDQEINRFKDGDCDILITTGGLGPTHDDLTKEVLMKNLHLEMELNGRAKETLDHYFHGHMASCNLKQAYFPKEAVIIENHLGTADGAIVEQNNKIYVILVGPPFEMMPMVKETVIPYLQKKASVLLLSQEYIVMGNGESFFEEKLAPFYREFSSLSLCPYASLGKIRYQLIGLEENSSLFAKADSKFRDLMADYIVSDKNEEIEEVLVHLLDSKGCTIAFGESCTGGMLASKIINVPNASKVIHESLVTYSNESKVKYLGVNPKTLLEFGAVSAETVSEMAEGLFKSTQADVCVAVSGIAGPSGGSDSKPVGLVHYAIKIRSKLHLESKIFQGSRDLVRMKATMWILFRIYKLMKNEN